MLQLNYMEYKACSFIAISFSKCSNIELFCINTHDIYIVSKGAKIRNRYNQVPHLTQDTRWKVTNLQYDITKESQEVSPFPAGDHKAHIKRRAQRQSNHKTEQKHKISTK